MIPIGNLAAQAQYPDAQLSFVDSKSTDANQSTYTWTGVSFGAEAANRVLVALVVTQNVTITSATIGGVSATIVGSPACWIVYATVPTGTSGTIVFNLNTGDTRNAFRLYRVVPGKSATPINTIADSSDATTSSSLTVKKGGVAVLNAARSSGNGAFTTSWNGTDTLSYVSGDYGSSNFRWNLGYIDPITTSESSTFTSSTATKFTAIAWR